MSATTLGYILLASTILGTVGGIIETKAAKGGGLYKFGSLLASLGQDLATIYKVMKSSAAVAAASGIVLAALVGTLTGWVVACAAAPTPAQQEAVGGLTADDAVCIANGATREQIDSCRDQIRHIFCGDGGVLSDSGGCGNVRLSDGGLP